MYLNATNLFRLVLFLLSLVVKPSSSFELNSKFDEVYLSFIWYNQISIIQFFKTLGSLL